MNNKLRSFLIVVMSIVVVMAALPMNTLRVNADGEQIVRYWIDVDATESKEVNDSATVLSPNDTRLNFSKDGYAFAGWYKSKDKTGDVLKADDLLDESITDLYGEWTFDSDNYVNVTLNPNDSFGETVTILMPKTGGTVEARTIPVPSSWNVPEHKLFVFWRGTKTDTAYDDTTPYTIELDETLNASWVDAHLITYDANNVSGETYVDKYRQNSTDDYQLKKPEDLSFTYEGYKFTGWYSDSSDSSQSSKYGDSISAGLITSDIPLYAHWNRDITLYANYGTDEKMTQSVPVGTTATITAIDNTSFTHPDGKQFLGWASESGDNPLEYTDGASISITGDTTEDVKELYALWGDSVVSITFNNNATACVNPVTGSMADIKVVSGLKTVLPENDFSVQGYSFDGWEVDGNPDGVVITKDANDKYSIAIDDAVFTGSTITLKAKWIKNNYGISFIDWDGSVIVENAQVPYGVTPTCESPTRGDTTEHSYSFAGWEDESGTVHSGELPTVTGPATYRAVYTESNRQYSINASVSPSEAGTVTVGGSNKYSEDAALTVEPAVGYHVVGWTNNSADTGTAGTAYNFTVAGDHTVVVYLEKDPHTVNVTSSGGGEVVYNGPDNLVYGDIVKVVATPYEGYHFARWVDQDENEVSKDAAYEFTVTSDYSYKAVFEINRYDISVTAGAHGSATGSDTYDHLDSCEVVATPEKGYHFVGWEENGTIVSENTNYSFSVTRNRNLKAVFEINMYTVTYKNDDGTILQEGEMSWGSTASYQHMANPTKKPTAQFTYTFAGWDNTETLVTKDITYTATYTYTVNKYKITFANEDGTVLQTGEIEYGKFPVYEKDTPTKAATVQETFTFAGWDKEISKVTGETVYTATYTSKPITKDSINYKYFTVAFVTNGGSEIVSQLVAEGGVAFKPEEPLRERYTFGGWYIDAALTKPFSFATVITSDITLYAKWIKGSPDIEATYAVVGLGSTSFELGSGEDITVAVERSKDNDSIATHFKGVLIDGVEVDYYNYELAEDNNSVIIRADAFEGLEAGNHTITIVYDDGTAEVELVVTDANEPTAAVEKITETEAGDTEPVNVTAEKNSNWGLWIALGIVAVVVIAAIPIFIIKGRSLK